MKKSFVLTICLCVLFLLTAQPVQAFEKGAIGVGGAFSFSGYKGNSDSPIRFYFSIAPQMSYFIWDNFCIEGSVFLDSAWGGTGNSASSTGIGFGFGTRYFFKKFYGGLYFNHAAVRHKTTVLDGGMLVYYDQYNWRKRNDLTFRAGRMFAIAGNVHLDLGLFYKIGIGKFTNSLDFLEPFDNEKSELGTSAGITIFF